MDATPRLLRPPLRHRLPAGVRTALVWCGIAAFPVLLALTVTIVSDGPGRYDNMLETIPRYALPALVMALPAVLLRRSPLATLALMLLGSAAMTVMIHSWHQDYLAELRYLQLLAINLVVGFVAATRSRPLSVTVAVLTLCAEILIGYLDLGDNAVFQPEIPTLGMLATWMIGNSVRARRRYAEALRSQATTQAVTAERLRIARELHDMVAHSIGIIAIQAGVGSRVIQTQPAEAGAALRAIETTSRETLAGLRRVLGGLRQADPSDPAPRDPAPGLADLDRLAEATAEVGVRVELCRRGKRRPLPADIELSAYRIVQEAVTNVVRHAGTPRCRVTLDYREHDLHVEIVDEGRGGPVAASGFGIGGMRERVALLHGDFTGGPVPGGGFRVAARLPLPETRAVPA
ncbi:sensor histidine kinase [Plantactinospora sp. KLBMP9567]|uniref:sensor histidine kinase n=1 Tax=Plantactinospora sp. KLBMP9567 TaxID=3085900 RepID=UPI0029816AD4|nr:sensor histidine kinase [Plantactinospora sp. KLBMP9567]MDW5325842.1 sensor histidine kinase [Plantactinospora sp. KLBMP9567]